MSPPMATPHYRSPAYRAALRRRDPRALTTLRGLLRTHRTVTAVARELGVSRTTLYALVPELRTEVRLP